MAGTVARIAKNTDDLEDTIQRCNILLRLTDFWNQVLLNSNFLLNCDYKDI